MASGMSTAAYYIHSLQLQAHPEGGFYAPTYRSAEQIEQAALPARFTGNRLFSTAIYFLLEGHAYSAFHRIKSDELWHFYDGCCLDIFVLHPNGASEILRLGPPSQGGAFQHWVPAGSWFAAQPVVASGFTLAGCTVAPGFDFADFELAGKQALLQQFPHQAAWIERYCILP